jgi:hypothetical protein
VVLLAIGLWSLYGAFLVALDLPLVLAQTGQMGPTQPAMGFKVVTAKALLLCGVYGVGLVVIGLGAFRATFGAVRSGPAPYRVSNS